MYSFDFIILSYDQQLTAKSSHKAVPYPTINNTGSNNKASKTPLDTQQFGVSLMFIKERNNSDIIPPIMRQCVEYLSQPEGMHYFFDIPVYANAYS